MQLKKTVELTTTLLKEARRKLGRKVESQFAPLDKGEFSQGCTELCPFCLYQTKKHPRGSAVVHGDLFVCFSCNVKRRVE